MKALITHVYSKENKGDSAILSVLIKELERIFGNPQIIISTMEDIENNKHYDRYPQITSFLSVALGHSKRSKLFYFTYVIVASLFWTSVYKLFHIKLNFLLKKDLRKLLNNFAYSDIIIPVGGGYFRGKNNFEENINIIFLLLPIVIAILLKKTIVLYSQSIGPFGNKFQSLIVGIVLKKVDGILIREDYSMEIINELNLPKRLIYRTVDAAFLFSTNTKLSLKDLGIEINSSHRRVVGITVRNWLPQAKQENYEKAIAAFADYIIKYKKCSIIFISQVTSNMFADDDRIVAKRIVERMKSKENVWCLNKNYSHYEIKAIYENFDYLIGTRLHSVILSLTSNVPSIAIEYEHKTGGIFKDLGLFHWVIKIEDVTFDGLSMLFNSLLLKRAEYLKDLHRALPTYIFKAREAADIISKIYIRKKGELNDKSIS